jgi:transcription elongation factor Elf1
MEWHINVECLKCKRKNNKMVRVKYGQKTVNVGCKECGLSTEVELKEHTTKVGNLKVTVWYPYYGS